MSEILAGKRSLKAEKCGEKNPQQHKTHDDTQSLNKHKIQCNAILSTTVECWDEITKKATLFASQDPPKRDISEGTEEGDLDNAPPPSLSLSLSQSPFARAAAYYSTAVVSCLSATGCYSAAPSPRSTTACHSVAAICRSTAAYYLAAASRRSTAACWSAAGGRRSTATCYSAAAAVVPLPCAIQRQPALLPPCALLPPQAPRPLRVPSLPRATSASVQPPCPSQRAPSIWLLRQQICQNRWDRQVDYGSNACIFITLLLVRNIAASHTLNSPSQSMTPGWLRAITQAIECGNNIHDRRHQGEEVNFSPREAGAALMDEYHLTLGEELPASLSSLVPQEMTLHHYLTVTSHWSERQFAVIM